VLALFQVLSRIYPKNRVYPYPVSSKFTTFLPVFFVRDFFRINFFQKPFLWAGDFGIFFPPKGNSWPRPVFWDSFFPINFLNWPGKFPVSFSHGGPLKISRSQFGIAGSRGVFLFQKSGIFPGIFWAFLKGFLLVAL